MHLKDLLQEEISDFQQERIRLQTLFEKTYFYGNNREESLKQYFADAFRSCSIRGTFTDIDDFFKGCSHYWNTTELDGLLFYCEVIINITYSCSKILRRLVPAAEKLIKQCVENIDIILDKTCYQRTKDDKDFFAIIKKNALTSSVIEDIDDKVTAKAILEYNRLDMKGDLEGKRRILKLIGDFLEPTLQTRNELSGQLNELADDVSFCLNNLNIRHNNNEGNHKKDFLNAMSDRKLELLYDDAYRTALLLIELAKQEESHKRIADVRKQSKGTK